MKNNIIKDDREISMKTASFPTDISHDTESIASDPKLTTGADEMNIESHDTESIASDPKLTTGADEMNIETPTDIPLPTEPAIGSDESITEPATAAWQADRSEVTAFFEQATLAATEFFKNNRQLLITLGWIVLAILGIKFIFAALNTIDDLPFVTPILKLVGLVSVVRFTWRYLIREHDRQELIEIIDRTKVEVLGDRESLS